MDIENKDKNVTQRAPLRYHETLDNFSDIIEEHFLKDFIEDYNDYYKPVAKSQTSVLWENHFF